VLLFLGVGSAIHALDGEQDLRRMGRLRKKTPITLATILCAALAISGFPFTSGFFSKYAILVAACERSTARPTAASTTARPLSSQRFATHPIYCASESSLALALLAARWHSRPVITVR